MASAASRLEKRPAPADAELLRHRGDRLHCSDGPQAKPWSALVISTCARSWKVMLAFISSNINEHPVI